MIGPEGFISMMTMPGLQIGLDSWGLRSTIVVPPLATTAWLGLVSTEWNDPSNWSNGVPGIFHQAVIMPGPFQPVILTDVMIMRINLSEGATVITAPGASLIVTGE